MSFSWQELGGLGTAAAGSLCIGLLINTLRPAPLPLVYRSPRDRLMQSVQRQPTQALTPARWRSVELDEFQARVNARQGTVIDARAGAFYRMGHVPGAISLPRADFEKTYPQVSAQFVPGSTDGIVVYCSGSDCEDSEIVADALARLGHQSIAVYKEGWEEWSRAGLPQEKTLKVR